MAAVLQLPNELSQVDQIRMSCNAADRFVQRYYEALSSPSSSVEKLTSFYAPLDDNTNIAKSFFGFKNIWYNGNEFSSPAEFATAVKDYLTPARYEIDSYDCQPLNPDLNPTRDVVSDPSKGGAMSLLLSVSGECRIGPMKESEPMDFSETIILVPNLNHDRSGPTSHSSNEWVISSQIFRNV
ncbi:MAG: hypothetical protein GOMPHAMPRED_002778 [Gomphillus americanus]|uniref:NTF2 domain-containing protein n=1 Tax=Gomphillus americanus TaxID=1940652 RepID=A0A8H3IQ24_9LECA|nr:MAG: hypothetical protein GOMPHAMPRED_002778 [Gomphillus americanus]